MLMRTRQAISRAVFELRTLLLVGLLFLLGALFGCGDDSDKTGQRDLKPVYGPPPADVGVDSKPIQKDLKVGTDGPCMPATLYGPKPCASDSECATQYGAGWYCDSKNAVNDGCGHQSYWPICKAGAAKDAGIVKDGCVPVMLYGPKPCLNDEECVTSNGAGWYCDKNNAVNDGCGHLSYWPLCKAGAVKDAGAPKKDVCIPAAIYGPQPCATDTDCSTKYGVGWYCDTKNTINDGCGHTSTWPICKK